MQPVLHSIENFKKIGALIPLTDISLSTIDGRVGGNVFVSKLFSEVVWNVRTSIIDSIHNIIQIVNLIII